MEFLKLFKMKLLELIIIIMELYLI